MVLLVSFMLVSVYGLNCNDGYVESSKYQRCIACNPGSYHNKKLNMCLPCGFGEYSYKRGSVSCMKCHHKFSSTHLTFASTSCDHSEFLKNVVVGAKSFVKYVQSWF